MSTTFRLRAETRGDAERLLTALEPYEARLDRADGHWDVEVPDGPLGHAIEAALVCAIDNHQSIELRVGSQVYPFRF